MSNAAQTAIPGYLTARDRWLLWRAETKLDRKSGKKRPTKVPISYHTSKACDVTKPASWTSYDKVAAALIRVPHAWDGVGFALGTVAALDEMIIGTDADACLDGDQLAGWARPFLLALPTYGEISPSGTGIKQIGRIKLADLPGVRRLLDIPEGDREQARTITFGGRGNGQHAPGVQLFLDRRYFAITGRWWWVSTPPDVRLLTLDNIAELARLFGPRRAASAASAKRLTLDGRKGDGADDAPPDQAALRDKLGVAFLRNPRLKERWEGGTLGLHDTSRSGRDMSILAMLVSAGFNKGETRVAMHLFEHGKVASEPARYFEMMWQRTVAAPRDEPEPPAGWLAMHPPVDESPDHPPAWQPLWDEPFGPPEESEGQGAAPPPDDDPPLNADAPEWIPRPDEVDDLHRPPITVVKGMLHRLADDAERAIIASGKPVYHRGVLVRPAVTELDAADGGKTHIAALRPLGTPDTLDLLCRTARWQKWNERAKRHVPDDPPEMVARILLAREGQWRLPQLRGVLSTPTLRRDGSLLMTPGYDPQTRYFLALPSDLHIPAISDEPDKSEAVAGLALLEALLRDFPFIDDGGASRSVGVSLLITAVIRAALIVAPIHAGSSPAAGTGKSYWYDVGAAIVYGDRCPVVFAGKGPEELEKKLNGILLRGTSLFNLDNLNITLEGDLLCQAAERPLLDLRRLGKSDMFLTPNSALVGACGNNLVVHNDLNRRVVMASMDANMERPELRDFHGSNPYRTVLADRGRYIAAALTVVRAYLADPSGVTVTPLASYDDYTRFVREPLVWLGRADPARTMDALAAADPVINELHAVMNAWEAAIGTNKDTTAAGIVRNIETPPMPRRADHANLSTDEWHQLCEGIKDRWRNLGDALDATGTHRTGSITARQLGKWLGANRNRIANRKRFTSRTVHGGDVTWRLAENPPSDC